MVVKRAKKKDGVNCDWKRMTLVFDSLFSEILPLLVDVHVSYVRLLIL